MEGRGTKIEQRCWLSYCGIALPPELLSTQAKLRWLLGLGERTSRWRRVSARRPTVLPVLDQRRGSYQRTRKRTRNEPSDGSVSPKEFSIVSLFPILHRFTFRKCLNYKHCRTHEGLVYRAYATRKK